MAALRPSLEENKTRKYELFTILMFVFVGFVFFQRASGAKLPETGCE